MKKSKWLKWPVPNSTAKLRLFCFPYAGGTASSFRTWPEYMSSDIELCPVQLPGRESRIHEPPFTDLAKLVKTLSKVLEPLLDIPFAFYGHSMGTLIAFELARQLRREEKPSPVQLLVSGRCAPQEPDPEPPLHKLPQPEFIQGLRRYNGTPEAVLNNSQLMDLLVPILRADFSVCETYSYVEEPPLDCPISAFAGQEEISCELINDWAHQTDKRFESKLFAGGHFFLHSNKETFVSALSRQLERSMK